MSQPSQAIELEVTPTELAAECRGDRPPLLLDCREPEEVAINGLPGARHIPLGDIPTRQIELDPDDDIVVYCHHGVRSLNVVVFLRQQGFTRVRSLRGGIDAWSRQIDPNVPRY